jgi:hypothetical protein
VVKSGVVYAALLLLFCRSWLASEGGLQADLFPADVHRPTVGVSLLAMAT